MEMIMIFRSDLDNVFHKYRSNTQIQNGNAGKYESDKKVSMGDIALI